MKEEIKSLEEQVVILNKENQELKAMFKQGKVGGRKDIGETLEKLRAFIDTSANSDFEYAKGLQTVNVSLLALN